MAFKEYRAETKKNWGTHADHNPSLDQLNFGCMLRIADSMEIIARDKDSLLRSVEFYRKRYESTSRLLETERRRSAALRGHLNRLKRMESSEPQ